MNIADAVVIVFVLAMLALGTMKGFAGMAISFFAGLIAFFVSAVLARPIALFMSGWSVFDGLREKIKEFFLRTAESAASSTQQIVDKLGMPEFLRNSLLREMDPAESILTGARQLADRVFYFILLAIAFFVLLAVIRILLSLVEKAMEEVFSKVKLLDAVNRILGAAFGLVQAVLIVYIVLGLMALVASGIPGPIRTVTDSAIVSILYQNNLLFRMIA